MTCETWETGDRYFNKMVVTGALASPCSWISDKVSSALLSFCFVPLPSPPQYWFLTPTGVTSNGLLTPDVLFSVRYTLRILTGKSQVSTD